MDLIRLTVCLASVGLSSEHVFFSEADQNLFPPIYKMDDYPECQKNGGIYCRVDLKLKPLYYNTRTWKLIQASITEKFLFSRDTIHRAICIPHELEEDYGKIQKYSEHYVNQDVINLNFTAVVENVTCNEKIEQTNIEYGLEYFVYFYFIVLAIIAGYDYKVWQKNMDPIHDFPGKKYLLAVSPFSNLKKILEPKTSSNYKKLMSMQGLRTYTCILVIATHTTISYLISYIGATEYLEAVYPTVIYPYLVVDFFLVQIFFLIAPWLLTIEVFSTFERNRKFTVKDALLMFINRCIRLWPVLISIILMQKKVYLHNVIRADIPLPEVLDVADTACRKYWWATVFFFQNYFDFGDSCHLGSWYLSADVQLYTISLVILYFTLKYHTTKYLKFALIMSYFLFAAIIYVENLDVVFRPSIDYYQIVNYATEKNFTYLYTMSHVNVSTYLLGICFGIIYYRIKDKEVIDKKNFVPVWIILFLVLPPAATTIAMKEHDRISATFLGPLLKPMFSFGIGMGILGMSMNTGGVIKKIFENRVVEFLSQFTYTTYVYHFMAAFARSVTMYQPLEFSLLNLLISIVADVTCAFAMGMFGHLVLELPAGNIQKLIIPQVKRSRDTSNVKLKL